MKLPEKMSKRKFNIKEILKIVFAWLLALSILYIVYLKLKFAFNYK
jgi:hypothetical protein